MSDAPSSPGPRIRRIDRPRADIFCFTLHDRERREVLVIALGSSGGIGIVEERPRGETADAVCRRLRKEFENGIVMSLRAGAHDHYEVLVARGPHHRIFYCSPRAAIAAVLDDARKVLFVADPSTARSRGLAIGDTIPSDPSEPVDLQTLRAAGPALLSSRHADELATLRQRLFRALDQFREKLVRRTAKIRSDAARAEQSPALRTSANLLISNLHAIRPDASSITVTDWNSDPPTERTIEIDRKLGAKAQAEYLFQRARRLERGIPWANQRIRETEIELRAVAALKARVVGAKDVAVLLELEDEARALGAIPRSREASNRGESVARLPYREFVSTTGHVIWVGRTAADNDELTLRYARPHDLWLHARGVPGSHVIVRLEKSATCPQPALLDAATLAAHFSRAHRDSIVEVVHVERRYVRKGKGLSAGAVLLDRETVLVLRVEPDRVARLLANERR